MTPESRVGVIGAGSWGTALAHLLAQKGLRVRLWCYESEVAEEIARERVNRLYLDGVRLHPGILATDALAEALAGVETVVLVTPSHVLRRVLESARAWIAERALLVSASKGLEVETLQTMTQVIAELLPGRTCVAVSGPSFAREVVEGQPTAVVAASASGSAARAIQSLFGGVRFRVYTSDDVMGVELGGALKNVIAVGYGIAEGLGYGHNARAALLTRGLLELTRLGVAMGARARTFGGLAGMGDLVLTCTGGLSRNRSVGLKLGAGRALTDVLAEMHNVAEGVNTTRAAVRLAERHGMDAPIIREIHAVLFEGKPPQRAVEDLLSREPGPEYEGVDDA